MNTIAFIIPYFGKVPSYFQAFLYSIAPLHNFADFFLIADENFCVDVKKLDCPSNLKFHVMSWEQLCNRVKNKSIAPPFFPYKLCDYKPLYGYIFEDFLKKYKYWGYCDVDLLMGNVVKILKEYSYEKYDRFGAKGHFTIYRNDDRINTLWKKSTREKKAYHNFEFVQKTTYPCHFDEEGMNVICKENEISFFEKQLELNTSLDTMYLHSWNFRDCPQIFTWENGSTYTYVKKNGSVEKIECMYIHFQWTKILKICEKLGSNFLLTHEGFFNFDENKLDEYFERFGKVENQEQRALRLKQFAKQSRKTRLRKLWREFKTVGFRALYNIACRSPRLFNLIAEKTL